MQEKEKNNFANSKKAGEVFTFCVFEMIWILHDVRSLFFVVVFVVWGYLGGILGVFWGYVGGILVFFF